VAVPGSIIVVNGPSSSGKSTLCRAAQVQLPRAFLFQTLDTYFFGDLLPRDQEGRVREWTSFRPRIVDGFFRSLKAFALSDVDVISELILEDASEVARLEQEVDGLDVFWVGLHAPVEELERRERERGNRTAGDARRDVETVHGFRSYDLDLDTTRGVAANTAELVSAWTATRA